MGCSTGKIGYPTSMLAETAVALAHAKSLTTTRRKLPTRVYYCGDCGRYHMTSYPPLKGEVNARNN